MTTLPSHQSTDSGKDMAIVPNAKTKSPSPAQRSVAAAAAAGNKPCRVRRSQLGYGKVTKGICTDSFTLGE